MRRVFIIALPHDHPSTHAEHEETPTRVFVITLPTITPPKHKETPTLHPAPPTSQTTSCIDNKHHY
jgi:hypothetical protein